MGWGVFRMGVRRPKERCIGRGSRDSQIIKFSNYQIIRLSMNRTANGDAKRTASPLTPALSPLRGEGEAAGALVVLSFVLAVTAAGQPVAPTNGQVFTTNAVL